MKKNYEKPLLQMESFLMDIDILSNLTKAELDALWVQYCLTIGVDPETYESDDRFQTFVNKRGYDNNTSGYCYMTIGDIS